MGERQFPASARKACLAGRLPLHTDRKGASATAPCQSARSLGSLLILPQAGLSLTWAHRARRPSHLGRALVQLLQVSVFIPVQTLTCSSLLSPTPLRPGGALRRSETGLLPSCHSLFQTKIQSVGPTNTSCLPDANAAGQGQKPLLKRT